VRHDIIENKRMQQGIIMARENTGMDSKAVEGSDLTIDEDIEIKLDRRKGPESQDLNNQQNRKPEIYQQSGMSRATIVGILLLIAFILNLIFPIDFMLAIYDVETSTGETVLEGRILDLDGNPVENVTVDILDTDLTVKTSAKGEYRFDKISVGVQTIEFYKPGYSKVIVKKNLFSRSFLEQGEQSVNVIDIPGNLPSAIQIDAFEGVFIDANVYLDNLNRTIFGTISNSTGQVLNDVQVELIGTDDKTTTDEFGNYLFTNATPGAVDIQVTMTGNDYLTVHSFFFADNKSVRRDIVFDQAGNRSIDDIADKSGNIIGRVESKDEETLNGVTVKLIRNISSPDDVDNRFVNISFKNLDLNGDFNFSDVPLGRYNIIIESVGYKIIEVRNITIHGDSTIDLDLLSIESIDDNILIDEEILNEYTVFCLIILVLLPIITLAGAISAVQRKRYGLAFMGAIAGMAPMLLAYQVNVCGAGIVSLLGFTLLVFSRNEFYFKNKIPPMK
jgi:hypothetical protein